MYWDKSGLVVEEHTSKTLYIKYATCRGVIKMLEDGKSSDTITSIFRISREQLGLIIVGYIDGEFSL